jgi:predicted TIM-barrel fold metal-dependent hydrolase
MSVVGIPVIDFHCHFPVAHDPYMEHWEAVYAGRFGTQKLERLRADARWYQEQWWRSYAFPLPETDVPPQDVQAQRWLAEVQKYGLEQVVFVSGGTNDEMAQVVAENPDRFTGFAYHDPFAPGAAEELRRAVVDLGLRGYKLLAPALRGPIDDPALDPVWRVAEELGIPVLVHFGPLGGGGGITKHVNINPLTLHDVAKGFPTVPFVVPHFGCGYPGELLQLAWACRNVYVDTSGNNEWVRWMPYPLTVADLFRKFVETIGPERVIFGSDSEWFPRGFAVRYLEEQWRTCREIGIGEVDLRLIFRDNAARLLGIAG